MQTPPYRESPLQRHWNAALEKGALLTGLIRCRVSDREPLYDLRARQNLQLIDLLHDFAFQARRTIELADPYAPGLIARASKLNIGRFGSSPIDLGVGRQVTAAEQSLWWLLGRVIHSKEVKLLEHNEVVVGSEWAPAPQTTSYWSWTAFAVRSDKDGPEAIHNIRADSIVEGFLMLTNQIEKAINASR